MTNRERELDRFPYGREGSASDRVGIKASPGVSLAIPLILTTQPGESIELCYLCLYQTATIMRPISFTDKPIAPLFCTTRGKTGVFVLEMELIGSPVPVKRILRIPENMNLGYVQEVLMLAMGWEGNHLKEIRCGGFTYFTRMAGGEDPDEIKGFPQRDSFLYTLGNLLKLPGDSFTFIYDLGDDWKHIVKLTDILPNNAEHTDGDYPGAHLISGQGACPPEDVGGVDGYADMLKSLAGPEDDGRKSYLKWLGRDFNPEYFDLHELQNRVDDFQRVIGEARWRFYHL